jgi:hypothetical protein
MVRPGSSRRVRTPTYRAVLAEKTFRGSLEDVIQQVDEALGSSATARVPAPLPTAKRAMPKLLLRADKIAADIAKSKKKSRKAAKPPKTRKKARKARK